MTNKPAKPLKSTEQNDQQEELLTIHEVARRLRVDDTTVRRWVKSGALEAITLPHRGNRQSYRVRRSTLEALLNESPTTRRQAS